MEPAPNCAICNAPAYPECRCESDRLKIAVEQAEKRAMSARMQEIRDWVINNAREQILKKFKELTAHRKTAHAAYLSSLPYYQIYMQYSGNPPLHPTALNQLQHQIRDAHAELKRGVDADWRASVQRYPEVLDYYYGLVEVRLPNLTAYNVEPPTFGSPDFFVGSPGKAKKRHRLSREMASPSPIPFPPMQTPTPRPGGGRPPFRDDRSYVVMGQPHTKAPPVVPHPPAGYYGGAGAGGFR